MANWMGWPHSTIENADNVPTDKNEVSIKNYHSMTHQSIETKPRAPSITEFFNESDELRHEYAAQYESSQTKNQLKILQKPPLTQANNEQTIQDDSEISSDEQEIIDAPVAIKK